jgi:nitrate reductase gamma subunit
MNILLFILLPYASVLILIIGSAYKYKFQKNDLNKIRFLKEIPLFHLGLAILIFGHIIGFLIPSYVLAWNGQHMRLLIIEIGAFGLGLATLFSLIIFLIRQIKQTFDTDHKTLYDNLLPFLKSILLYLILLILIISGLWIANFYRWGSSWYAGVMTPYLRSLMKFYPDISAVQLMPLTVKIHIISAFLVISIFPFTGLFSLMIYTINYLSLKNQTPYYKIFGLIGAGLITTMLALYFGSSYEEKKADHKIHLMTTDNKIINFEKEELKETLVTSDSTNTKQDSTKVTGNKP